MLSCIHSFLGCLHLVGHELDTSIRCWTNVINVFWIDFSTRNTAPTSPPGIATWEGDHCHHINLFSCNSTQAKLVPCYTILTLTEPGPSHSLRQLESKILAKLRSCGRLACATLARGPSSLPSWPNCAAQRREVALRHRQVWPSA